tara:strand:- start:2283 stop:2936 length:654 start_codon:yes stop_codon:yes gene_type:complete
MDYSKHYDTVVKLMDKEHLFYHTIDHINFMLESANEIFIKNPTTDCKKIMVDSINKKFFMPDVLFFSIIFHDCFYIPGNENNEEVSATIAHYELKNKKDSDKLADIVYSLIKSTKKHEQIFPANSNNGYINQLLIDLDLLNLAADYNDFLKTNELIKKEFCFSGKVSPEMFDKGRIDFFNSMLNKQPILKTNHFSQLNTKIEQNINNFLKNNHLQKQ